MKVEIKFRVWDAESREMMYQPLADLEDFYLSLIDGKIYEHDGLRMENCIRKFTLMQYTGFQDCEGTEIYEGDIILTEPDNNDNGEGNTLYEVVFSDGCWCGIGINNKQYSELLVDLHYWATVVDNVYI